MLAGHRRGFSRPARPTADAPVIEGDVAPDPSKALTAATKVFEKAGDTLQAINEAANGLAKLTKSAENLDDFLTSGSRTRHRRLRGRRRGSSGSSRPTRATSSRRSPACEGRARSSTTRSTPETPEVAQDRASPASPRPRPGSTPGSPTSSRSSRIWSPVNHTPTTDFGQAVRRINLVASDLELLTRKLRDGRGGAEHRGHAPETVTQGELHDNLNTDGRLGHQAISQLKTVLTSLPHVRRKSLDAIPP